MLTLLAKPDLQGLLDGRAILGALRADASTARSALHDEEAMTIASAAASRRREFAAGRDLARDLLLRLGAPPAPLRRAATGEPEWPDGFTGSISHAAGLAVAAVARSDRAASLGVDIEPDEALETELFDSICTPAELVALEALPSLGRGRHVRRLFSAKEAVFKALFPPTRRWIDFREVEIGFDTATGRFEASPASPDDPHRALIREICGEMRISNGWIVTGAWLPPRSPLASNARNADDTPRVRHDGDAQET